MPEAEELRVGEDPALASREKQISLTATKADDSFRVDSEDAGWSEWLLDHPAAEIETTRAVDDTVVAVTALIPVGLVDLKAKPRNVDQFGRVLSSVDLRGRDDD